MSDDIKGSLKKINDVSRQLLSRILAIHNQVQENTANGNESNNDKSARDDSLDDNELTELMSTRQRLIHCLFEKNTHEEISMELNLLNKMITLDAELSSQSKACKNILAEQVIRLKKVKNN